MWQCSVLMAIKNWKQVLYEYLMWQELDNGKLEQRQEQEDF